MRAHRNRNSMQKLHNKQYGYKSSATRAINNYFKQYKKMKSLINCCINRLDNGCYEIQIIPK